MFVALMIFVIFYQIELHIRLPEDHAVESKHVAVLTMYINCCEYIYIVHLLVWIINKEYIFDSNFTLRVYSFVSKGHLYLTTFEVTRLWIVFFSTNLNNRRKVAAIN
jgi:hypothetical protein